MMDIKSAAEAYLKSYQKAVTLGSQYPQLSTSQIATAIASHYSPNFISFTSGHTAINGHPHKEISICTAYLNFLVKSGLGIVFRLEKYRIEAVSAGSALCYVTWSIEPKDGRKVWNWENVYGYRRRVGHGQGQGQGSVGIDAKGLELDRGNGEDGAGEYVGANGCWEFVVSDNELNSIVERVPTIFTDMFGT